MFGIGFAEIIVIAFVAFMVVGPKGLPEMAKNFGKWFVKFRRMTFDVRSGVDQFMRQAENELRDEEISALRKELAGAGDEIRNLAHSASREVTQLSQDFHQDGHLGVHQDGHLGVHQDGHLGVHQDGHLNLNQEIRRNADDNAGLIPQDPSPQALGFSQKGQIPSPESQVSLPTDKYQGTPHNQSITFSHEVVTKSNPLELKDEVQQTNMFETPLEIDEKKKSNS